MTRPRIRRIFRNVAIFLVTVIACGFALSRWVSSSANHARLTAQLQQAFGRPVEVGSYEIAWLPLPGIEANEVTIGEDPRFGYEYLLRAESVVASVRWTSLLTGHFELGTLRFVRPSLNVVRTRNGSWNLESWLPPPAVAAQMKSRGVAANPAKPVAHLSRIEIDSGRINFRQGNDVKPFALTEVTGSIDQTSAGRWQISLVALPERATVHLQQSGTLQLTGAIAGTSARLQPAELSLTWSNASAVDALRLLVGGDPGIRGIVDLQLTARTSLAAAPMPAPSQWNIDLGVQISDLHRWDLPSQSSDPRVSLSVSSGWQAGTTMLQVKKCLLEGLRSKVSATGSLDFSSRITPHLTIAPSEISWNDVLNSYRAFTPTVANDLSADGTLRVKGEVNGFTRREISLSAESEQSVVRLGTAPLFEADHFILSSTPATGASALSFMLRSSAPASSESALAIPSAERAPEISVMASAAPVPQGAPVRATSRAASSSLPLANAIARPLEYTLRVDGRLERTEAWLDAARTIGKPLNSGWDATGGLELHLGWQWTAGQSFPRPSGALIAHLLDVRLPLVNQPIELAEARLDLSAGERRVTLTRAAGLGTHWQGTMNWQQATAPLWQFDLAAEQLDATELDRWLGPRARPNWLSRLISPAPTPRVVPPAPDTIHARGRLRVASFSLAPLAAQSVQAQIEIDGRTLNAQQIQAQLYGGNVSGSLEAKLTGAPAYRFTGRVEAANVAAMAASSETLARRVAGLLSGNVEFSTHGIGRAQLLESLEARGKFVLARADIEGLNLKEESPTATSDGGRFSLIQGGVTLGRGEIDLQNLLFAGATESYQGSGRIDFSRHLNLDLHPAIPSLASSGAATTKVSTNGVVAASLVRRIQVTGVLEAPHVSITEPPRAALQSASPASQPSRQ
jgi:uncharacterized protein involved in outer membrane biogenesis